MKEMHAQRRPSRKALYAAFDRHPPKSVSNMATRLGLRGRKKSEKHEGQEGPHLWWLRFCHQHFARREAGWLNKGEK